MIDENNIELARKAKRLEKLYFTPWHEREWRIKAPIVKHYGNYDDFYSFVINKWIPGQPDKDSLMQIFIILEFDLKAFLTLIIQPPPSKKRLDKVA